MTNKLTPSRYKAILADVIQLFRTVQDSLVTAYWKTGQYVVEIEQGGADRARYGSRILANFSSELTDSLGLGFSVPSLQRMRRFYQDNPKYSPATKLSWAHHIELMQVPDAKVRKALERKAVREGLTRDNLRVLVRHEAVRAQVEKNLAEGPEKLAAKVELLKVPKLGLFDTCRIKDPNETPWPDKNVLLLDHGFKGYRALTPGEARGLKAGDIVAWTGAKLVKNGRTAQDLFTYRAYLESVVDGDTLWVMLDTNMRGASRQKLRLRGIDCPEIDTVEGQKAKKFVEDVLKGVPSLTVLSSKNPSFDRYEADVFFIPARNFKITAGGTAATGQEYFRDKEGKEVYLNNLILENGYAVKV